MILPQFRQLGAAASKGWRVALQEHARAEGDVLEERVGLVWISSDRMAESCVQKQAHLFFSRTIPQKYVQWSPWKIQFSILTRSCSVADAPCIDAPPETLTVVLGAGEAVRDELRDDPVRTFGRSDINGPAADGGGLREASVAVLGVCFASGRSDSANVFESE